MRPVVVPFFIAHLGCPHRCVFCDQEKIAGARGVVPDAAAMLEKIAQYRESSAGRGVEVAFYGGTFTALPQSDQEYLLGALQPLLSSGSIESVRLSTRPDAVDAGVARFLKEMGVGTVELGVQSMDNEVLSLSRRGHTADDVGRAIAVLKEAGLSVGIQLMPGLPGDSSERSLASLRHVLALESSFLRIYPTLVIDGTDLAELYRAGSYQPLSLEEAVSLCKRMVLLARRASVPVIRVGLQPTAELDSPGTVLAGPYHPAFGQMVESALFYDLMVSLVSGLPVGTVVSFAAPRGRTSDLVGQKRRNVARLRDERGIIVHAVEEDDGLSPTQVTIAWEGGRGMGDLRDLPAQ